MADVYHIPALADESIEGLNINPDGTYIDLTFGGGGHSRLILSHLSSKGRLFSFDQDADAKVNLIDDERFCFVESNFRFLRSQLRLRGVEDGQVDGVLADWVCRRTTSTPPRGAFRSRPTATHRSICV